MQIRIASFGGMQPNTDARLLPNGGAQIAHNCLLEDGSLQALPQWVQLYPDAFSVGPPLTNTQFTPFPGYFGLQFFGPPFGVQTIFLDADGALVPSIQCSASGSVSVTPAGLSKKAVNRVYGVTATRVIGGVLYESPMTLVQGGNAAQVMFEGDYATVAASGTGTGINVYRSTSDVTTGSGVNGAVTANWQLVCALSGTFGVYVDGGAPTDQPYDTYLPRGPLTPPFAAAAMGLLEGGWVWLVSASGGIALSDRFSWGYWPVENQYSLGAQLNTLGVAVTGAVSVGNRLYIGTQAGAFIGIAEPTEQGGVVLNLTPIPGTEACIPQTMVATSSGAMYCSANGLTALSAEGATMLTRGIARGVVGQLPNGASLRFDQMGNAVYHGGRYMAISGGSPLPLAITGTLPNGSQGTAINYQYTVSGGVLPYGAVTVVSGSLPPGISMSGAGLATGTYTTYGTFVFRLGVTDGIGAFAFVDNTVVVAASAQYVVLSDTPILYWPLNELSGTSAIDYSGNGRNGNIQGAPAQASTGVTLVTSAQGIFLDCGTVSGSPMDVGHTNTWSQEIVVTLQGDGGDPAAIAVQWNNPNVGNYINGFIVQGSGVDKRKVYGGTYGASLSRAETPSALVIGARTVLCVVRTPTAVTMYVNGVSVASFAMTSGDVDGRSSGAGFTVGGVSTPYGYYPDSYWFHGIVAQVSVYDHSLTPARVLAHAQAFGLA